MSVRRESGAMPKMTARQMATASLAVPKSVMKTIAGREAEAGWAAAGDSFWVGVCEQATPKIRRPRAGTANRRVREIIISPQKPTREWINGESASVEAHEYT